MGDIIASIGPEGRGQPPPPRGFQEEYLVPFPNRAVENFAAILAVQAKFIRVTGDYEKMDKQARHAYREIAAEYAALLGVDPFKAPGVVSTLCRFMRDMFHG